MPTRRHPSLLPGTRAAAGARPQRLAPLTGAVYAYATFGLGPDGAPAGPAPAPVLQSLTLGQAAAGGLLAVVRCGLADDGRGAGGVHPTAWLWDGRLDHFGPYVRPDTPFDFRLRLDLGRRRLSAWVRGRGDDGWFLLADDLPLAAAVDRVDALQLDEGAGLPAVRQVQVQAVPWPAGERCRPHPQAAPRAVGPRRGFRFQPMRSTWRQPGRHVTVYRAPGVHCGFPDVAAAGPDHLVCVWRNGSHTGGTGGLSVAHSYDCGQTWSTPVLVTRLPGNCPRLQRLRDGSLLLLVDIPSGPDQFTATWDLVLWDSLDGGHTWTRERWLRTRAVGGGGAIVPSRVCEQPDGAWLLAASYFAPPPGGGRYVEILDYYRSADRGQTWTFVGQPGHFPPFCLSEPSPVLLPDGRLGVWARESRTDGMPGACGESSDGGRTWRLRELPHPVTGRTCAGLLRCGLVLNTFRSGVGRAALRACFSDPRDRTGAQPAGAHLNDRWSVGLKDGALHLNSDGRRGQFTQYTLRPPDSERTVVHLSFEAQVLASQGRAATVSIPFAGRLRLLPDEVWLAHDPSLRVAVAPGRPHAYRVESRVGRLRLRVDGRLVLDTDRGDDRLVELPWTRVSPYALQFGNEALRRGADGAEDLGTVPDVYPEEITPAVTGHSLWQSFAVRLEDPQIGTFQASWVAARDGFPDQYQLDHILEVEASANGHDQGYSGWVELEDGGLFVVHYTDDTAAACTPNPHHLGVPWIRGTFVRPQDWPPAARRRSPRALPQAPRRRASR